MKKFGLLLIVLSVLIVAQPIVADAPFDHNHKMFNQILQTYVHDGTMNYLALAKAPKLLKGYIEQMGDVSEKQYKSFTTNEKLAFWLNFYNACALDAVLQNYPIHGNKSAFPGNSPRQIEGFWTLIKWDTPVGRLSLNQIEFDYLNRYNLAIWVFALNKATVSGGALMQNAFTSVNVREQLKKAVTNWVKNPANCKFEVENQVFYISEYPNTYFNLLKPILYKSGQFLGHTMQENAFANLYLEYGDNEEAKQMIRQNMFTLQYLPYDWALNDRPAS